MQSDQDDSDLSQSDDESEEDDEEDSWISWFVSLKGNELFCVVDEEYINDDFNLAGLSRMVPYYDYALNMITDVDIPLGDSSFVFLFPFHSNC